MRPTTQEGKELARVLGMRDLRLDPPAMGTRIADIERAAVENWKANRLVYLYDSGIVNSLSGIALRHILNLLAPEREP
jgi:hypothetical protein